MNLRNIWHRALSLAFAIFIAVPVFANPCRDMVLNKDGTLNEQVFADTLRSFNEISNTSIVYLPPFRSAQGVRTLDHIRLAIEEVGGKLPGGATLLASDATTGEPVQYFRYTCPISKHEDQICTFDRDLVEEISFEEFKASRIAGFFDIQDPKPYPGLKKMVVPLEAGSEHVCELYIHPNLREEPLLLEVVESRPARSAFERFMLRTTNDPTPNQYTRGVYVYDFQLQYGIEHEFHR